MVLDTVLQTLFENIHYFVIIIVIVIIIFQFFQNNYICIQCKYWFLSYLATKGNLAATAW